MTDVTSPGDTVHIGSPEALGNELRCAREKFGLTQKQAAYRAGVSDRTVRNAEAGAAGLSCATLFKLLHMYGKTLMAAPMHTDTYAEHAFDEMPSGGWV